LGQRVNLSPRCGLFLLPLPLFCLESQPCRLLRGRGDGRLVADTSVPSN
jgi:hypothetical protein